MALIAPMASGDPIAAAQRRNERFIAWVVVAAGTMGMGVAVWRMATIERAQGARILVFAVAVVGGYAAGLFRKEGAWVGPGWVLSTIEVSTATVVMLLDAFAGPTYLLTSSTALLYPLAIAVTSLRLRPWLTGYATALAMAQHFGLYLYVFTRDSVPFGTGALSQARMYQELTFRLAVMGLMGVLGAVLAATLRKETARAADEERVRTAFGHYVDQRVVRRVLAGDLRIAPERREITVLFVDIRDFTRMAESADAATVFARLSGTLEAFSLEVQRHGGIVNKYLGDGLLAFFGAPEEQHDQSRRAVRAALNIVQLARQHAGDGRFPELKVGLAIHAGAAVVGDLGGERREYTAIGDVVNVASRLESLNKELGTTVLITRPVVDRLGEGAQVRKLAPVSLRGREAQVEVFELLSLEEAEASLRTLPPA